MAGKSRRPVSDQKIIADYERLQSAAQVAALYGISDQTVYYVLGAHGIKTLSHAEKRQSRVSDDEIVALYQKTGSGIEVAKRLGVNDKTVYGALAKHGVAIDKSRLFRDEKLRNELIQLYQEGRSAQSLAEQFSCSVWTVSHALLKAGVETRKKPRITDDEIKEARRLYQSGMTFKQTAKALGRSERQITSALNRYNPDIIRSGLVGPGSPHWRGGKTHDGQGYVWVWLDKDDPMASMRVKNGRNGNMMYVLEHRLVMARKLGRPLRRTETVHHIDGNHQNNAPDNLQLRQGRHGKHVAMCCLDCGSHNIGHVCLAS